MLFFAVRLWNQNQSDEYSMLVFDPYALAFSGLVILFTLIIILLSPNAYSKDRQDRDDIFAILLFTLAGAIMMTAYANLIMLFIGLETLSISLYVLAGSNKYDTKSNEAAMKYFLTGSFASGFMVFGIALIYGAAGSFSLDGIGTWLAQHQYDVPPLFTVGLLLLIVSLAFKVAAAPFHFWAPDVYEGAPTIITAFMASIVKVAGFAAFFRIFSMHLMPYSQHCNVTICVLSAVTVIIANITALYQTNLKRLIAYSGIAHAGYMLLALTSADAAAPGVLLLYGASYGIATLLLFAVVLIPGLMNEQHDIAGLKGLGRRNPLLAVALTVALFSLTGIPPLAGFMAKYRLFATAMNHGAIWPVLVALAGSAVSAVYYFRPVIYAWFHHDNQPRHKAGLLNSIIILFCVALLLFIGFFPSLLLKLI
jgi:NADH-quinone oxidoreductase subunit N